MRRETAASIYDSVYVMPASKMPGTEVWSSYRERGKSMPILMDATTPTMIHFLPAYLKRQSIKDEDLRILTNGKSNSVEDAWVNGVKVVEWDITCKNGYIQKVDGVMESNPNMAQIIRSHANMSMWSHLLDRYSAPYYTAEGTREYNRIYNNEDSVFIMRYYSERSAGGDVLKTDPKGNTIPTTELLKFDPGWNQYIDANSQNDLHNDAGAMIVPTNEALQAWWNGAGRELQDEYKDWDSIPNATLAKLLRVNMLGTFSDAVPTKFNAVLNDAKEPLGITPEDVDSCFMGCNGVVYLTNKVFTPAEYSSVAYPALAHASTMNVIYWAIDNRNFLPYLLSMDSKYALVIPTNDALKTFLDPATYGAMANQTTEDGETVETEAPNIIEFSYDNVRKTVKASRYSGLVSPDGTITKAADRALQAEVATNVIEKLFDVMMDQLIIVIPDKSMTLENYVSQGYQYFKTKGGSMIRVTKQADGSMGFEGGWQMEHNNCAVPSTQVYEKVNGRSYQVENQVPMAAQKSFYLTLKERPEYSAFLHLLENDYMSDPTTALLVAKLNNKYNPGMTDQGNKNFRLFDNYNYTVYVPSNASIEQLQQEKKLPTWDELEIGDNDAKLDSICLAEGWYEGQSDRSTVQTTVETAIRTIMIDFIRYHVQDYSLAIGMAPDPNRDTKYESMKRNPETGRFYPLQNIYDTNSMTVTDAMGNVRHVVTTPGEDGKSLYNNICHEYWFEGSGMARRQFMGSDAVIHLIDGPLFFENMRPWREVVKEALNK